MLITIIFKEIFATEIIKKEKCKNWISLSLKENSQIKIASRDTFETRVSVNLLTFREILPSIPLF